MYNSVIVAYRDRPDCLKLFLQAFYNAIQNVDKNSVELVLTELNHQDERTPPIINEYKDKINIKYFPVQYTGNFWKTKALNHSARFAEGELITMVDVDGLVPPAFFVGIEKFFAEYGEKSRLSHRVRFLNEKASKWFFENNNFTTDQFNKLCIKQCNKYKLAKERYTKNNLQKHELHPNTTRGLPIDFKTTQILGNSHFTITKKQYMDLGGYDERIVLYGCDDLEFNVRSFKLIGESRMNLDPAYTVYHLQHKYDKKRWKVKDGTKLNVKRYKENMKKNIVKLPTNHTWGRF